MSGAPHNLQERRSLGVVETLDDHLCVRGQRACAIEQLLHRRLLAPSVRRVCGLGRHDAVSLRAAAGTYECSGRPGSRTSPGPSPGPPRRSALLPEGLSAPHSRPPGPSPGPPRRSGMPAWLAAHSDANHQVPRRDLPVEAPQAAGSRPPSSCSPQVPHRDLPAEAVEATVAWKATGYTNCSSITRIARGGERRKSRSEISATAAKKRDSSSGWTTMTRRARSPRPFWTTDLIDAP